MVILIIGGGGREHAIAHALSKSEKKPSLHIAPGNVGMSKIASCHSHIKATDIDGVVNLAKEIKADYVFVAPDDPLVMGMVDVLEKEGFKTFGPRKDAAIIEGSKVFSKSLMKKYNIPTAEYECFDNVEKAIQYIESKNIYPRVIKCDGLALGKGAIIANNYDEACAVIKSMLIEKKFGDSGNEIIIEEFMTGPEVTVLAFTDGKTVYPMRPSTDHKRAFDNDKGLNTGGMGTIAPTPFYTKEHEKESMEKIILPTIKAMVNEGRAFKGCLYFGLMLTPKGIKVIEYNCRFGDPETQVVLPLLKTDLIDIMTAVCEEKLSEIKIEWQDYSAACVVMASGGYPEKYEIGFEITGIESAESDKVTVYHAGTKLDGDKLVTSGGRVLGITGFGENLTEALDNAYNAVEKISFKNASFRSDIGKKYK